MTRTAVWAALLGVASGLVGGVAGGWLVAHDPGRGRGVAGTLRGDLDAAEADGLAARAETATAIAAFAQRLDALERRAEGGAAARDQGDLGAVAKALAEDLRTLRDAVSRDLSVADLRLAGLERRVAQLVALAPPPSAGSRTIAEEEEALWLNLSRDPDPLRRFSALNMLGRVHTERSVRASVEGLRDPAPQVVWQAARNLAAWDEKSAARDLAALLRHDDVTVRSEAHEALRRLGAPDVAFDAAETPEHRKAGTEALERWAAEVQ